MKLRSLFPLPRLATIPSLTVVALLSGCPAAATRDAGIFHQLTFAEACAQAKTEGKLVFVDVWAAWCGPCKLLDQTTWQDAAVVDLLTTRTIAIKINADEKPEFAVENKVDALPTLLVFRPDGTELARIVGYVDATKFRAELELPLAAKP